MAAEAQRPYEELVDEIVRLGGASLYLCYQCGVCTATCPWSEVRDVNLRKMLRLAQFGLGGLEGDSLWLCTTCRACVARCPRGVEITEVIGAVRRFVTGMGMEPDRLKTVLGHLGNVGNEWGGAREDRLRWAEGLRVRAYEKGMDLLLYVGCTASSDPRVRDVARSLVRILDAANVRFGVLGNEEACIGDAALRIGDVDLFHGLAAQNLEAFRRRGVERVVAISPHDFGVLTKEYPRLGSAFEVEHYTQLLARLLEEDRIPMRGNGGGTVTYHDPCYLGRHNGVYEEPRKVLESVPGLRLEEMDRTRENSLCCGSGGGRIFLETPPEERFSASRVAEAQRTGAGTLCTACPYCLLTLEDGTKTAGKEDLVVRDIAEVVARALATR